MIRFFKQFKLFFQLILLIILSVFLVYYIPVAFNRLLFLLFFIPIWRSKKDFFWFAFVMVILDSPGGLFSGGALNDPYRLPIYNFAPGISFNFQEIYLFILVLKGVFKKRWFHYKSFVYRKQIKNLGFYLIFLIFLSLLLGMSFVSMKYTYKTLISLSVYFSAIFVFSKEDDVIEFFKTIFPFAFVSILLQIYGMVFNQQLVALFKPGVKVVQGILNAGQLMRPIEFSSVLLICFFGGFLYLDCKKKIFSNNYLILIIITSYIGVIMTATRGWVLSFSIMIIFYLILNYNRSKRNVVNLATGVGIFLLLMFLFPLFKNQVNQSWVRLETIEQITQSEIKEGSLKQRATIRGPRVMEGYYKSTILFGAGFSDLYIEYNDNHVGFRNILLNSGIVGSILFLSFAMTLFFKPQKITKKVDSRSDLKSILLNLPLLVPAVLMINSMSQFWGYDVGGTRVMVLAFYISISSVYINEYKHLSYKLEHTEIQE